MGYEHGTVFMYNRQFWFFNGYSVNAERYQTLILRDADGNQTEALESECKFLLAPSGVDWDALENPEDDEELLD